MSDERRSRKQHSSRGRPSRFSDHEKRLERDRSPRPCTVLHVSNIPYNWTWKNLKDLFTDRIGDVAHVDVFDGESLGQGVVEFYSTEALERAFHEMKSFTIDGHRLYVNKEFTPDYKQLMKKTSRSERSHDYARNEEDLERPPKLSPNYFGLNKAFLDALNIKPPIPNKAFVLNLSYKVTKEKIREIFSMAGLIHHVEMLLNPDGTNKGMAVVEFDHPVEVVQAISMFNKQVLYDRPMAVQVDKMSEKREFRLPEGLKGIGPGLGFQGSALRNVAYTVEKQMDQRHKEMDNVREDQPFVTPHLDTMSANQIIWRPSDMIPSQHVAMTPVVNVQNAVPMATMNMNNLAMNNMAATNLGMTNMAMANMGMAAVPVNMQDNSMMSQAMGGMTGQMGSGFMPSSSNSGMGDSTLGNVNAQTVMMLMNLQNQMQQQGLSMNDIPKLLSSISGQKQSDGYEKHHVRGARRSEERMSDNVSDRHSHSRNVTDRRKEPGSELVVIKNLPLGVTPKVLHEKLQQAGEVKFVEMTGPNSALVSYLSVWNAEQAIKRFHRTRYNGSTIDVNFF